jgi:hemerythrin-like domain-containing protein
MEATQILMSEHRVIEEVLNALENAAQKLNQGEYVRPGFFIETSDFIKGFADGCHHQKEEDILFKTMTDKGFPSQGGPIGVMLHEHEQARLYTRSMRQAAEKLAAGDETARTQIVENALNYVSLLRQHIIKEDTILYPMAEKALSAEEQTGLVEAFEHLEHEETGEGVHEKYLALAASLQKEIQST